MNAVTEEPPAPVVDSWVHCKRRDGAARLKEQLHTDIVRVRPQVTTGSLSSDKQERRDCDSPIAHWPLFHYSFLFIEG